MKRISEHIAECQKILTQHGDIPIVDDGNYAVTSVDVEGGHAILDFDGDECDCETCDA